MCFQRCCSLSATKWGISQICWRTRWHRRALHSVPAPAALHRLPFRPFRRLRLPRLRPLLSIRTPPLTFPPPRHFPHSLCPSLLLLLPPKPHLLPPLLFQVNSWWPVARPFFSRGLRWSRPSIHNFSRQPNLLSRYQLGVYLTLAQKLCL